MEKLDEFKLKDLAPIYVNIESTNSTLSYSDIDCQKISFNYNAYF